MGINLWKETILAIVLFIASGLIYTNSMSPDIKRIDSNVVDLNINTAIESADVILVGSLQPTASPYEVLGKNFYKIKPETILKGNFATNSLLFIVTNIDSSEGSPAKVEAGLPYMLFLQQVDITSEGFPKELVAYHLVRNWKGIISLDEKASEQRAIRNIKKKSGIWIPNLSREFIEAVKFSTGNSMEKGERDKMPISDGAVNVYRAMKMEQRQIND